MHPATLDHNPRACRILRLHHKRTSVIRIDCDRNSTAAVGGPLPGKAGTILCLSALWTGHYFAIFAIVVMRWEPTQQSSFTSLHPDDHSPEGAPSP
jgi:hypothetical protein